MPEHLIEIRDLRVAFNGEAVVHGILEVTSDGNAALGTLTSGRTINASSTGGGLTFGTLKAATGITMDAARAWSLGNAISGTALKVLVSNSA
mgnify:CR=1 FL=1